MSRHHALLSRHHHSGQSALPVSGEMTLTLARVHEICGPARQTLALTVAAACEGPVVWIAPGWANERLNGEGLTARLDLGRLILVQPQQSETLLWAMEEALRAGGVPLVIAELPAPPSLTPVRRLHLAAETGAREGTVTPLGLLLTSGDGGAQGVESRWHLAPEHSATRSRWRLERRRARSAPPAAWPFTQEPQGPHGRLRLVPQPTPADDGNPTANQMADQP